MSEAANGVAVIGSLNIDRTFSVPAIPAPGETVLSTNAIDGLGGKGANQAIAAARAGAATSFIGRVGSDGAPWLEMLSNDGINTSWVTQADSEVTGSAVIAVDPHGENSIIVDLASNARLVPTQVAEAIGFLRPTVVLFSLEVPLRSIAAGLGAATPIKIVNAAPFDEGIVEYLDEIDVLVVNETEHAMLHDVGAKIDALDTLIVTRGADGLDVISAGGKPHHVAAPRVDPIDTTGAGDTFCGYVAARLSLGDDLLASCALAASAAALATTRPGASASIPSAADL